MVGRPSMNIILDTYIDMYIRYVHRVYYVCVYCIMYIGTVYTYVRTGIHPVQYVHIRIMYVLLYVC